MLCGYKKVRDNESKVESSAAAAANGKSIGNNGKWQGRAASELHGGGRVEWGVMGEEGGEKERESGGMGKFFIIICRLISPVNIFMRSQKTIL